MNYKNIAADILKNVGGEKNILNLVHCATRLRFTLRDDSIADKAEIEKIQGVITVVNKGGQLQVVIGNDVPYVYKEIMSLTNFQDVNHSSQGENNQEKKKIFDTLLDTIAGIFTPVLPAMTACGMLKAILILLTTIGWLSTESTTYQFLSIIGDAPFYYMPVLLAVTSASKFGCNKFIAAVLGCILIHPDFSTMVASGNTLTFFGLPVLAVTYGSSVIPIILAVWLMSYVEKFADKISPKAVKFFLKPLITFMIVTPVMFVVIAPLGLYIGTLFAQIVYFIQDKIGWLAIVIMAVLWPLLVMVGMQKAFIPVMISMFANTGYEMLVAPAGLAATLAQGAAVLAVACKTKKEELKQLGVSSGISALLAGITEPAMYGITLKYKKVMIGAMIGAACGGAYMGIFPTAAYTYGLPSLLTLPGFMGGNDNSSIINAVIGSVITIVVTFIATLILYKESKKEESEKKEETTVQSDKGVVKMTMALEVVSPLTGKIVPLKDVNDAVFNSGTMGKGIAILPEKPELAAPFDGVVSVLFDSGHAIGLVSTDGTELLMHIGIDTVNLNGKYFHVNVQNGQTVHKGDTLITFDIDKISGSGYDIVTPVIVTNTNDYTDIIPVEQDRIEKGEILMHIY